MIAENDIYKAPSDVWARIAAPLPADAIEWRQDGKPANRDGKFIARFVAYVEAGTVRDRLDSIVPGEWDLTFSTFGESTHFVAHEGDETIFVVKSRLQVLGVVREDIGQGRDPKAAATDAFKRAAVRFGIGHELYDMPIIWVELDGDGKYAKPIEDPAAVYARRISGAPTEPRKAAPPKAVPGGDDEPKENGRPPLALDEEQCPKCGGRMWDNRITKRNPRAPDFKCRDRSCDGVIWPGKPNASNAAMRDDNGGGPGLDEWNPDWPLIPDGEPA